MHGRVASLLLLLFRAAFLLHVAASQAGKEEDGKIVVVTNNHTNCLSVRCFSFDDEFEVTHLPSWGQYKFRVMRKRFFFPSAAMFNCSTNMGTFVAYYHEYECVQAKGEKCDWRFDEESAYLWDPKLRAWILVDYFPNYESLRRGGVIKGFFVN